MSNQIETLIPRIVSRGLLGLRQQAILPRLVNSDLSAETARKGDVIDVPMAQPITVSDVEPGATMPPMDDSVIQSVPVRLNHWKKASFYLTDQEMAHIEQSEQFMPLQMHEAIRALVAAVHQLDTGCLPSLKISDWSSGFSALSALHIRHKENLS